MSEETFFKQRRLREGKESPELFRGSIGFDFVFSNGEDGKEKCYCIEINGDDSGVFGIQEIPHDEIDPQHQILAKIRGTYNPVFESLYHKTRRLESVLMERDFPMQKETKTQIRKEWVRRFNQVTMFPLAYKNPEIIQNLTLQGHADAVHSRGARSADVYVRRTDGE